MWLLRTWLNHHGFAKNKRSPVASGTALQGSDAPRVHLLCLRYASISFKIRKYPKKKKKKQNNWLSQKVKVSVFHCSLQFTRGSKVRQATGVNAFDRTLTFFLRPFLNDKLLMKSNIYCHSVFRLIRRFCYSFAVLMMIYKNRFLTGTDDSQVTKKE